MRKAQEVLRVYQESPIPDIKAVLIEGKKEGIQFKSKDLTINVYTDGTIENPAFSYWSTYDTLQYLEVHYGAMYLIVRFAVDHFKLMEATKLENETDTVTKAYRSKIIAAHLEHMTKDKYYLVRLRGDEENYINIDKPELRLLKAYYDGNITAALTPEQRDEIYRSEWAFHVCEDIKEWLANYSNMSAEEWPTEKQIQYAAHLYAYDGKYDCTQDYWENIEGVVKMALESCKP